MSATLFTVGPFNFTALGLCGVLYVCAITIWHLRHEDRDDALSDRLTRLERTQPADDTLTDAGMDILPEPPTEPITDDGYYQRIRHIGEHRKGR